VHQRSCRSQAQIKKTEALTDILRILLISPRILADYASIMQQNVDIIGLAQTAASLCTPIAALGRISHKAEENVFHMTEEVPTKSVF
jgi:hypothetical protein